MSLQAINYANGVLSVVDQLLLPTMAVPIVVRGVEDAWSIIDKGQVKGDSAVAIVASLSLAVELNRENYTDKEVMKSDIEGKVNYLLSSNPTGTDMKATADRLISLANAYCKDKKYNTQTMKEKLTDVIEGMLGKDIAINKTIGSNGAHAILTLCTGDSLAAILTHGSTGSFSTAGWGTALGVVRSLHAMKKLDHVYCTETRVTNCGAYLTAFELVHDEIPATIIIDSAVASLMKKRKISAVVVGARVIAGNGDTANDLGTYQIAVLAKIHQIPFYVAAPISTINRKIPNGERIKEADDLMRPSIITARGIPLWNPSFDITPCSYITGIITERGVHNCKDICHLK